MKNFINSLHPKVKLPAQVGIGLTVLLAAAGLAGLDVGGVCADATGLQTSTEELAGVVGASTLINLVVGYLKAA